MSYGTATRCNIAYNVARNAHLACNVSGLDFQSTSATLPVWCVHPLKQALRQITQFIRLSANHVLLTRREPADHQNNCEKNGGEPAYFPCDLEIWGGIDIDWLL